LASVAMWVVVAGILITMAIQGVVDSSLSDAPATVVLLLVLGVLALLYGYLMNFHASVATTPDGLVIRNPLQRSFTVAWSDIASMTPRRAGVMVARHSGRSCVIYVLRKSLVAPAFHRESRAETAINVMSQYATDQLNERRDYLVT
jgi:hypothetical protein